MISSSVLLFAIQPQLAANMSNLLIGGLSFGPEVLGDKKTLLPDPMGTLEACRELIADGFEVLCYTSDDPIMAARLKEAGATSVIVEFVFDTRTQGVPVLYVIDSGQFDNLAYPVEGLIVSPPDVVSDSNSDSTLAFTLIGGIAAITLVVGAYMVITASNKRDDEYYDDDYEDYDDEYEDEEYDD